MLKLALLLAGAALALGITITVIGWLLPVAHAASRSATLRASPETIFAIVSDVGRYPEWWSDITRVDMLPADTGRIRFRQHDSTGTVIMEVVESVPPSRFVTRIADRDQPFGGTWTWDIAPDGAGTRLTLTEHGEVYNPIFRFVARFVFGHSRTIERCLAALAVRSERRTKN